MIALYQSTYTYSGKSGGEKSYSWRNRYSDTAMFKPDNFGQVKAVEVHYFSDASVEGYGQCCYLRLINELDQVYCSFIVGKAPVIPLPLKHKIIPRLELAAATTSARMSEFVKNEL